jgi:small conductance mechanosensitive channel
MRQTLAWLILAICILGYTPGYAQQKTDPQHSEIEQLEGVIQLLEDKKQVEQLKALLQAKKELLQQQAAAKTAQAKEGVNFVLAFRRYQTLLGSKAEAFWKKLTAVTSDYRKLTNYFSDKQNLYRLLDIGLKLLLAGGIGLLLLILLKKSTKRWSAKLDTEEITGFGQKFKVFCFRLLLDIYPVTTLIAAVVAFLWLVFPGVALIFTHILIALASYRITLGIVSRLITPEDTRLRLIGFGDETANYVYIWSRRLLLFSLWAYLAVRLSSFYGLRELAFVFNAFYKVGIVAMIAVVLAQWKESISARLSIEIVDTDKSFSMGFKRSFNSIVGNLYLFVLVYASAIVLLSLLGFESLWRYLLYSALKSLAAIAVTAGIWRLWDVGFQRLFAVSANIRQRLPEIEEQVNRYVMLIGRLGHLLILLLGFLLVLDMWQVDVFGFFAQYSDYLLRLIRIPIILGIAIVFVQLGNLVIKKFELKIISSRKQKENIPDVEIEKQVATISGVLRKGAFITVWVICILMVVRELGFDIGPALAGAGIFGIALGFGTQNLVRDIISGLFMIAENQIRVGDVAILNGTGGLVEAIQPRTTVLRGLDGTVHVFPNGSITSLSNMTREFSFYLFDIGVAYKEDVDRVIEVLKRLGDEIMQDEEFRPFILEPLEILGLDKFGDSAVIIKARIKTLPIKQWAVGREMNRRIKKRFDEEGIEIPFPHRTFYFGEVSPPVKMKLEEAKRQKA